MNSGYDDIYYVELDKERKKKKKRGHTMVRERGVVLKTGREMSGVTICDSFIEAVGMMILLYRPSEIIFASPLPPPPPLLPPP